MFPFKKPPTRAEIVKKNVLDAVSGAADSLSVHAHEWIEEAHDFIEGALESAHDKLEIIGEKVENAVEGSPLDKAKAATSAAGVAAATGAAKGAGEAAEKLGALKASAVAGAVIAGKSVADKVGESVAAVRHSNDDEIPDVERAREQAQNEIDKMNKKANKYSRELERQLASDREFFVAEQERMEREHAQLQTQLDEARAAARGQQSDLAQRRLKADRKNNIVRVPVAPTDEVVAIDSDDDGDYEYRDPDYESQQSGGGNAWLIVGGVLLAGAGALYYLFSSTGGRRKRAQIQDRVSQVADGVREKVTHDSDESGDATPDVETVIEAAREEANFSNEKIADAPVTITGTVEARLPPTSDQSLPDKAIDTLGEVTDKVADGIAGAGAFLADKLEAAGASAKNAAHSAAEKIDDAKDKTVAKIDDARKPTIAGAADVTSVPNAVVVEIIADEPARKESAEEIMAEVEETVRNIENSAQEKRI